QFGSGIDPVDVGDTHGLHTLLLGIVLAHQPSQDFAVEAAQRSRGEDALRRAAEPITACTPVPATQAAMPAERSPSVIRRMRAPASRISAISFSWRGRSNTTTTRS